MFAFVAFIIVREHRGGGAGGQIPFQRYVALAHAQAMCLRCVCVALEAAWRCSSVGFVLVLPYFGWFGFQFE